MRTVFWISFVLLLFFEFALVYIIMPLPGSQQGGTLTFAYFLYRFRWVFRFVFVNGIFWGLFKGAFRRKWVPWIVLIPLLAVIYVLNFKMAADKMFRQVNNLIFAHAGNNSVDTNRLVIGVSIGSEAKAYPIQFLGYHHFVADSIGGKPILVTYCTVCRTGRVYDPRIDGVLHSFRLVGMDRFNAMIEDKTTKNWWQQATGVAVAGPKKGFHMIEIFSTQTTIAEWLKMFPTGQIMQPDPDFLSYYSNSLHYEDGTSKSKLTGTESMSWENKSWVIGIEHKGKARAYDWNGLKSKRMIQDTLAGENLLLTLAGDGKSFYAFSGQDCAGSLRLSGDTLYLEDRIYLINGTSLSGQTNLTQIKAYQEFWHSWRNFRPHTDRADL